LKCGVVEGWGRSEMRKDEVLQGVREEGNILHAINRRKANWVGHFLHRNCLLKHFFKAEIEGRIEMTGRRGIIHMQLLDDLKGK
jgi:hypothetical protein